HRQHYNVTFALLAVAAVAYALLQSLVAPALLTIQHDLGTNAAGAAWILTAYLLSASVLTPIAGRLGDMFGKKRAMVVVLVVIALLGILLYVPESPVRTPGRIDPLGAVLLAGWLTTLLVAVSQGSSWGWRSWQIFVLVDATIALLFAWVWAESRSKAPLVDMQ